MKELRIPLVICITAIIIAVIFSFAFYNRNKADDMVNVTGLGQIDFEADLITWEGNFSEQHPDLVKVFEKLNTSKSAVIGFLEKKQVNIKEVIFYPVSINHQYKNIYNNEGNIIRQDFSGYSLTQRFKVESREVDKIESVSREITDLIRQDIEIHSGSPDFFYTNLSELKLKLVGLATEDAKNRATQIALNAKGSLGKIRYSSMGVLQIIGRNSSPEADWMGSFDTQSRYKTATLTVKLQYEMK